MEKWEFLKIHPNICPSRSTDLKRALPAAVIGLVPQSDIILCLFVPPLVGAPTTGSPTPCLSKLSLMPPSPVENASIRPSLMPQTTANPTKTGRMSPAFPPSRCLKFEIMECRKPAESNRALLKALTVLKALKRCSCCCPSTLGKDKS